MSDNIFQEFLTGEGLEELETEIINDDVQSELFPEINSDREKKDTPKQDKEKNTHKKSEKKPVDPEYEKLKSKSSYAQLNKHIQVEELNHLKLENERVTFLKNTGKVAEFSFMDYLYISFMEKNNIDLIKMVKRLKHRYQPFLSEEILNKVIEMLQKEITYVLKGVKDKQKQELEEWKDGLQ